MDAITLATDMVKLYEGLRLQAYKPIPSDPWTVGYGATGVGVDKNTTWTIEHAKNDLERRLRTIEASIKAVMRKDLTDYELAALISFTYNVGFSAFFKSTLRMRINNNDEKASDEFLRWTKADGKELAGLVKRRQAERQLFLRYM